MKRPSSASMPLPIALALAASVVALGALWVAPVVGLALFGLVVLAGLVLLVRGSRAAGVVIAHPPVGAIDSRCGAPASRQSPCARATPELSSVNFIKRVVAGPGDTIAFRDGLVVRNGRPVSEPYAERCTEDLCEMPRPITVPDDTWFLAGDNRGESDDSRFWGPVPTSAIVGIVRLRYWPLGKVGTL